MSSHHRARRLDAFVQRAGFAPDDVYRHRARGWEYIPVHPFGDEPKVLARLSLQPQDCVAADAWWAIDGEVALLQVRVARADDDQPGLHALAGDDGQRGVMLVAVVAAPLLSRTLFEDIMTRFAAAGFPDHPRFAMRAGDPPLRLDAPAASLSAG